MSVEILAPAGSYDSLVAAVNNGADAVYLGGSAFSARANAVNFSEKELADGVRYAHLRGVKVYVALNTLVEDGALHSAYEFAGFCYDCGVDALIVQDLGVLSMLRECYPDFKLNASTQMTIHNLKGVRAAEKAGFSRVVLSRELSGDEIGKICSGAKAEIEVFAHGALCMSYSGQCLMSSFIGGRSGNRGACAQPCRLPYGFIDSEGNTICEGKYLLSLKDLCLIDEIGTLERLGVTSLKIEGRMKSPAYTALCANLYDKYRHGGRVKREDLEDLQSVFSRSGFTKGYFEGSTGRHMLNIDKNNDDVYRNITHKAAERAELLAKAEGRSVGINGSFTARMGEPATLCLWDDAGHSVTCEGTLPAEPAVKVPLTDERVLEQMSKTGGTPFTLKDFVINADAGISLPVRELNLLRRRGLAEMEEQLLYRTPRRRGSSLSFNIVKSSCKAQFTATAHTYEQAAALGKADVARIYIPERIYNEHREEFSSDRYFVTLPAIERQARDPEGYDRICTSNFSQIYDSAQIKHGGFRMNVYNSMAVKFLKAAGYGSLCLSPEMNLGQISAVSKDIPAEVVVYGYLPVMTVGNCVIKSALGRCTCGDGVHYLKDRMGALFPVIGDENGCVSTILNSTPVYMGDKAEDIRRSGVCYANLYFTTETAEEVEHIISLYEKGEPLGKAFTRGHFYRGV